jgi:hypothetical protein
VGRNSYYGRLKLTSFGDTVFQVIAWEPGRLRLRDANDGQDKPFWASCGWALYPLDNKARETIAAANAAGRLVREAR